MSLLRFLGLSRGKALAKAKASEKNHGRGPGTARLYIEPIFFGPHPQFYDGEMARLAHGSCWFAAYDFWFVDGDGTYRHQPVAISQVEEAIALLPDTLQARARMLIDNIGRKHTPLTLGTRHLCFDDPHIMAIINMTPDSFSDGGHFLKDIADADGDMGGGDEKLSVKGDGEEVFSCAAAYAVSCWERGASIVDIGGESTRPGSKPVWEGDEIKRTISVIERLQNGVGILSIDTRKGAVMQAALSAGVHIINDISALLYDEESLNIVKESGAPLIIMHAPSSGDDPHANAQYDHVVLHVYDWLEERLNALVEAGIARDKIILDPGIGFGKSLSDNLAILNHLALFHSLGRPLLLGVSRKRLIGALSKEAPVDQRLGGSLALALHALDHGVQILRVHDVKETMQAYHIWRGRRDAAFVESPYG